MMTKFNMVVNIEVAENRGEDANIILGIDDPTKENVVIAVFDGLGGRSAGFEGKTGGRIASERSANLTRNFFSQWGDKIDKDLACQLQQEICYLLKREADAKMPQSRLKGSLANKRLCTTIALASIAKSAKSPKGQEKFFDVKVAWMGDSRIYLLTPENGLQQLTKDDLVIEKDAFKMITEDPPISQYLTADTSHDWEMNYHSYTLPNRGCILACTDGCFQYLPSPWHFEKILLKTLMSSDGNIGKNNWQNLLETEYDHLKQDDISLILYSFGFQKIQHMQNAYKDRLQYINDNFFDQGQPSNQDLSSIWSIYRKNYEEKIISPDFPCRNHIRKTNLKPHSSQSSFMQPTITHENQAEAQQQNSFSAINENFKQSQKSRELEAQQRRVKELLAQGDLCSRQFKWDEAIDYYKQIIAIEPNHIEANFSLGIAYVKTFQLFQAESPFIKVVQLKSEKSIESLLYLGHIYYKNRQYREAIRYFDQVFQSDRSQLNEMVYLEEFAESLKESWQSHKAIEICNYILDKEPNHADAMYWIGSSYYQQNNLEKALEYLEKSLEIYRHKVTRRSDGQPNSSKALQEYEQVKRQLNRGHY